MKKLTLILCLLFLGVKAFAQAPTYDDLIILYADGKYDKLVRDAEKYTQKESTKADALPYIWMSKGLYKLSQNNDRGEEFKNAFKDAISALGSAVKKDKSGEVIKENQEYVDELMFALYEAIDNDIDAKDFKKASGWVTRVYKVYSKDAGVQYLDAAMKFKGGDKSTATTTWREADKAIKTVTSLEGYSASQKAFFILGVTQTAECYVALKQVEKAKTFLNSMKELIGDDDKFNEVYTAIVG